MMSSKRRVFWPPSAVKVLPCIGSHIHTTGWPSSSTARRSAGQMVVDGVDPEPGDQGQPTGDPVGVEPLAQGQHVVGGGRRARSWSRPGCGCRRGTRRGRRRAGGCARRTHSMWAEQSYQSSVSESRRVSASS